MPLRCISLRCQGPHDLLLDRRIHEHRQNHRSRSVDRHGYRCAWSTQVKACIQLFHVIQRTYAYAARTDFPINVGTIIRVFPIKSYRVKGRTKPLRLYLSCGSELEAPFDHRCIITGHSGGYFSVSDVCPALQTIDIAFGACRVDSADAAYRSDDR